MMHHLIPLLPSLNDLRTVWTFVQIILKIKQLTEKPKDAPHRKAPKAKPRHRHH